MEIGKEQKEITIEPVKEPSRTPVPEEAPTKEPVKTPSKEPVPEKVPA